MRYGCLWISTSDQARQIPEQLQMRKKDQNLTLNPETKIGSCGVMKFTNEIRIRQVLPACRTVEK